jgi:hypothetical protein
MEQTEEKEITPQLCPSTYINNSFLIPLLSYNLYTMKFIITTMQFRTSSSLKKKPLIKDLYSN